MAMLSSIKALTIPLPRIIGFTIHSEVLVIQVTLQITAPTTITGMDTSGAIYDSHFGPMRGIENSESEKNA